MLGTKHTGAHCTHTHETLPMHHDVPNAKICRIFALKIRQNSVVFLLQNLGDEHIVHAMTNLI